MIDAGTNEVPRYWAPPTHEAAVFGGFLSDPENRWSSDDAVRRTEDLAAEPFVVLLGEQGMGKSHVLKQASCPLRGDLPPVELGTYSTDDRLERKVLEAPWVAAWVAGQDTRTLVLDGLDEAQLYIPTIDDLLAETLSRWPLDRLRLRIACRSHSWSAPLQDRLAEAYALALGTEGHASTVVNLLPLRRADAATIAVSRGVDAAAFMAEVDRRDVGSLAGRPLTLLMLIERFRSDGHLDIEQTDLYWSGLRALVTEEKRSRARATSLTADQVLAVGSRVAAAWVFGGHGTIRLGNTDAEALGVDDLVGGREGQGPTEVDVDLQAVQQILSSGLMRAAGDERFTWSHATFADHLAARWVVASGLGEAQSRSLFLAPDGRLWPQVRLTAGWCVALDPSRFGWLVHSDPVAFVDDVDLPGQELKVAVIDALFDRRDELMSRGLIRLDGLAHPGVADQIRPRLRHDDEAVRWVALNLAQDCDVPELRSDLLNIALDDVADPFERASASRALLGRDDRPVPELRPLVADSSANAATDDDLFGLGLRACWPDTLTTSAVLRIAREPRRDNYTGSYAIFLDDLASRLSDADMPAAVAWLHRLGAGDVSHHLEPLATAALGIALRNLDNPFAASVVVDRLLSRLADYSTLGFDDDDTILQTISDDTRHLLVELTLSRNPSDEVVRSLAMGHRSSVLGRNDLAWLADQVGAVTGPCRRQMEMLLSAVFSVNHADHVAFALTLPDGHPAEDVLMVWFTPQALAERLRWAERDEARRRPPADNLNDELDELLDRFEEGDDVGFWVAMQLLSCRPGSRHMNELTADIASAGRWATLTTDQQTRMLDAGVIYVERAACQPERWLGEAVDFHPARAAYRALVLMKSQRPADLDQVSKEAWRKWAPILAHWTTTVNGALWDDKAPIFDRAIIAARAALVDAVIQVFAGAAKRGDIVYASQELAKLMDRDLATRLLGLLGRGSLTLDIEIVTEVAKFDFDLVRPTLLEWLASPSPQLALTAHALGALWHRDPQRSWRLVADRIEGSEDHAAQIVGGMWADHGGWRSLPAALRADVYLWMLARFPRDSDPKTDGVHWIGPREEAARRRDDVFGNLVREGTHDSLAAVRRILASGLPGLPGRWALAEAASHMRRATWTPVPTSTLRLLAERETSRLVRSAEDLLEVVDQAFVAIQERLTGATPESHLLWDTRSMAPKGEDEMSDYLANKLTDQLVGRGVVVNREVQVRRVKPTGRPRQVDIQIDATVDDDTISLPIEVKGSWNRDVESALKGQLAEQYMKDLGPYGVYVVLFPDIESWSGNGSSRARASRLDRTELMQNLLEEASELSEHGVTVRVIDLDVTYMPPGTVDP